MGLLYFFETTVEFRAVDSNNLFKRWLDILEAFTVYPTKTTGVEIKQFWKVSVGVVYTVSLTSLYRYTLEPAAERLIGRYSMENM